MNATFHFVRYQIFILSEGSTTNKHECIEFVSQRADYARLFTVGIGESCHRAMITGLARAGNGKPHILKLNEKPYNMVSATYLLWLSWPTSTNNVCRK